MTRRSAFPPVGIKPYTDRGTSAGDEGAFENATIGWKGTKYKIKVMQAQFQMGCDVMDITGEKAGNLGGTDDVIVNTVMKSMTQMKGRVTFAGHIPTSLGVGLANLEGNADHSANEIDVEFMLGMGSHESNTNTASLNLKFRMVMESITIDWNLDLPYIGVTMTGPTTGSYGDSTGTSATAPIQEVG
tara:strand:+ start:190 stop:750 length:561 start_codon:yes stop_codon:yes gene_type:complete